MPEYQVTDPESGKTLRLTGDSPPTEAELERIFSRFQPDEETGSGSVLPAPVAEAASGLSRGLLAIPDVVVGGVAGGLNVLQDASAGLLNQEKNEFRVPGLEQLAERGDLGGVGQSGFMEPGLARTVVQEGSEVAGGFLPALMTAGGTALQSVGKNVNRLIRRAAPSVEQLKESARALYKQVDDMGVRISQDATQGLADDVARTLKREGHNVRTTPKVQGVIDELADLAKGAPSVSEIETARRVASNARLSNEAAERRLGAIAVEKIDDFVSGLPEGQITGANSDRAAATLRQARDFWQRSAKADTINGILKDAELAGSGLESGIRNGFASLARNKKRLAGFTPAEVEAVRDIAKRGTARTLLLSLGRLGFDPNNLRVFMPSIGAASGAAIGGATGGIVVPAAGTAAQALATRLTVNKAKFLSDMVRAGKSARSIATSYVRNVPKAQQNPQDLARLFMGQGVEPRSLERLERSTREIVSEAAFLAGIAAGISEIEEGNQKQQGEQPGPEVMANQ